MKDWKTRLRRLIALAEDQAGTPEGELAARLARQIMAERRATLTALDLEQRNAQDPFIRQPLDLGGKAYWRRRVASLTAIHCDCVCSFSGNNARLSGRQSSVVVAAYLYRVMSRSITWEQTAWLGQRQLLDHATAGNDFAQSAVLALENRLAALRDAENEDVDVTALVKRDRRALLAWLAERGVTLKADAPFPFAYSQDGYAAGRRIPLFKALEESN
ncbi:MAG: hypothetical protein AAFV53_12205 [Myxococcota bacterium]